MLLKEAAPGAPTAMPLTEFAAHLRLGFGFADDGAEDALLELYLRHAAAVVEARTGQALIARPSCCRSPAGTRAGISSLPVGPVAAIDAHPLRPDSFPGRARPSSSRRKNGRWSRGAPASG